MIGGLIMATMEMSREELLMQECQEMINRLDNMPEEDAMREGLNLFVRAGIMDETGKFAEPYAVLNS